MRCILYQQPNDDGSFSLVTEKPVVGQQLSTRQSTEDSVYNCQDEGSTCSTGDPATSPPDGEAPAEFLTLYPPEGDMKEFLLSHVFAEDWVDEFIAEYFPDLELVTS